MTRLTTNSQETTLGDLLSVGTSLYLIPFFQREYRWSPDKVNNLWQDVLNIVDGLNDKHFLGAMIVHGRRANPTEPKVFEVIDGQQRLTTAFLFIAALVRVLCNVGKHDEASKLAQNYLQIGRDHRNSNLRIHSSRLDRTMMRHVIEDLKQDEKFTQALHPYALNPLPNYGSTKGAIRNNYNRFKRFLSEEYSQHGIDRVQKIYETFLNNFTVVQIDVLDPTDGPKIFDSLNSKQEPMRISDLVRNEIFRKISDEPPEKVEKVDEEHWQPFYASFETSGANQFDKYLFPFSLCFDQNLSKSEVFIKLRKKWEEYENPVDIIKSLDSLKSPYLDTIDGSNLCGFGAKLATRYRRLSEMGAPSSILPFTMQLGSAVKSNEVSEGAASDVLDVIESFLVRRATVGIEPTGLHSVFKRLWSEIQPEVTPTATKTAILGHKTISWPQDEEFLNAIERRNLYGSLITNYLLLEFDRSLGGDKIDSVENIEHVLPRTFDSAWRSSFGMLETEKYVDALPNLVPITGSMNSSIGNQSYEKKRARFAADSKYKTTRAFAENYSTWTANEFVQRAVVLREWARLRWPN